MNTLQTIFDLISAAESINCFVKIFSGFTVIVFHKFFFMCINITIRIPHKL